MLSGSASISFASMTFTSSRRAASDWREAKSNRPSSSHSITHRTAELQRLQTPSKRMTGRWWTICAWRSPLEDAVTRLVPEQA